MSKTRPEFMNLDQGSPQWLAGLQKLGLAARLGILVAVPLAMTAICLPISWSFSGGQGVLASAVAAGVCLAGAVPALAITHCLRGPTSSQYGMLLAMFFRMGVPLGFALGPYLRQGALASAGIIYYLLAFYMVTLAVETVLSLPALRKSDSQTRDDGSIKVPRDD
ncbi:MAG: hypothetical protein N2C12_03275 [Planctomycetales bacterium]